MRRQAICYNVFNTALSINYNAFNTAQSINYNAFDTALSISYNAFNTALSIRYNAFNTALSINYNAFNTALHVSAVIRNGANDSAVVTARIHEVSIHNIFAPQLFVISKQQEQRDVDQTTLVAVV